MRNFQQPDCDDNKVDIGAAEWRRRRRRRGIILNRFGRAVARAVGGACARFPPSSLTSFAHTHDMKSSAARVQRRDVHCCAMFRQGKSGLFSSNRGRGSGLGHLAVGCNVR